MPQGNRPPILEEIASKLAEIDSAAAKLKEDHAKLDLLVDEKIRSILQEKISALKADVSPEEFFSRNADFVNTLRKTIRLQYDRFFRESLLTLEASRSKLLRLQQLPIG